MKVAFTDVDQQSVNGRTARAVNRTTGEVHTVTIAGGEADFGQLTYQQAYEVYGVTASGARVTQVLVKTETSQPSEPPQSAPSLSATAVSDTRIDLDIGSVSGATGYEYRVDGGTPVDVGTNRTPQVTGLTAETQYNFEARAYNAEGAGPWSSVVQETTQAAGAGVVLTESFDKADGPGLGPDLTWTVVTGSFETVDGEAVAFNGPCHARAEHDLNTADQYAQAEITRLDFEGGNLSSACVNARVADDSEERIQFVIRAAPMTGTPTLRLHDYSGGTLTVLDGSSDTEPTPSLPFTMRIEVVETGGGNMRVRGIVNGAVKLEYNGQSLHTASRRCSIRRVGNSGYGIHFDNFEAGDL